MPAAGSDPEREYQESCLKLQPMVWAISGKAVDGRPGPALFVGAFVDELVHSGVVSACACPGSRSAPLTLLLRQHPAMKVWMHLAERSAAFFALGKAKAQR